MSQLLVIFGFFALVLVLVYWVNQAVRLFDRLIADGQSAGTVLEFTVLSLPSVIVNVLPFAAFVAATFVTNRLATESELTVVQATGYSPFRLARPVLVFGIIVTLMVGALAHYLVPLSTARLNKRQTEIAQNISAGLLVAGQFIDSAEGLTVFIREVTPEGELRDIFISDNRSPEESITYTASAAYLIRTETGPQIVMIDGMAQTMRLSDHRLFVTGFKDFAYDISSLLDAANIGRRSPRELWTPELLNPSPALLAETGERADRLIADGHLRISQSLMAMLAGLLGFSALITGSYNRAGVWRQIVGAIMAIVLVKFIETMTIGVARADAAYWPIVYLQNLVAACIVLTLLLRASRPAGLWHQWRRARMRGLA